ncbi:hypothetical protein PAPYR_7948 [Paratrimastix pyriformis]|uniref:Uncharacterized protein n=1 Tax=Paratrimastix pyriformis TaxID=342808 RepID=A0ABQ8UIU5_9EUKA|nr:hypothetical protein PAPYR_7948 [Paratrimastix pyriformis]
MPSSYAFDASDASASYPQRLYRRPRPTTAAITPAIATEQEANTVSLPAFSPTPTSTSVKMFLIRFSRIQQPINPTSWQLAKIAFTKRMGVLGFKVKVQRLGPLEAMLLVEHPIRREDTIFVLSHFTKGVARQMHCNLVCDSNYRGTCQYNLDRNAVSDPETTYVALGRPSAPSGGST